MGDAVETMNAEKKVIITATIAPEVSFAGHQCSVSLIREISIENKSDDDLKDITLRMKVNPDFVSPKEWSITSLIAGDEINIRDRTTSINGKFLLDLVEPMKGDLSFSLWAGDEEITREDIRIRILARNEWGGSNTQPELLATFSMPNDPAVDKIISTAIDVLRRGGKNAVLDGYRTKDRDNVWRQVSAIWSAVSGMDIKYATPPKSFEKTGQKIRLPSAIANNSLSTCLDTSMLFCSALEQVGLNSFVVLMKEHAFVGVWLQPETFQTLPMEDLSALRKRKDLNELVVFETTLATQEIQTPFGNAVKKASELISDEHEAEFDSVIDIACARDRQIMPLSLIEKAPHDAETVRDVNIVLPVEDPETLLGTFSDDGGEEKDEVGPDDRIEKWQRKLLDLTLRNPLLNFKTTQTNIPIVCPDPGLLEDILAEGKQISILPVPKLTKESGRDSVLHAQRTGNDLETEHARKALEQGRREIFVQEEKDKLESRLVNLFRKAKKDLEEGGANTLFLTIGSLSYVKPDRKDRIFKAPLILVPVELKRKSARSGVKLSLHEDEPCFNTTLLQMFKQDLDLNIPGLDGDLPTDSSGVDVKAIWETVRQKIRDVDGFELKEDVYLGTFSFTKYLMWKDLVDRTEMLKENPVVKHLIDREPGETYATVGDIPEPKELDQSIEPEEMFTPLPADSSQLATVVAADRGQDFVIIGPPGSGKSQTISNMISQLLGKGKKVLFVSEKSAALNVVYRRLKEVGLGEFCLELHSNKAKKSDVLQQFKSAWGVADTCSESDWSAEAKKIKILRDNLNEYVVAIHEVHGNGLTVHKAIGHVVKNRDLPDITLSFPTADFHSLEDLDVLKSIVHDVTVNADAIEDLRNNPLKIVANTDWSNAWQDRVVASAVNLKLETEKLSNGVGKVLRDFEMVNRNLSLDQLSALNRLATALIESDKFDLGPALNSGANRFLEKLEGGKQLIADYFVEKGKLSVGFKEHAWKNVPVEELQMRWLAARSTWWPKSSLEMRQIRKELETLGGALTKTDPYMDLPVLEKMKEIGLQVEGLDVDLNTTLIWKSYLTKSDDIDQYVTVAKNLITSIPGIPENTEQLIGLKKCLKSLMEDGAELLSAEGSIGRNLRIFTNDYEKFSVSLQEFSKEIERNVGELSADAGGGLEELINVCEHIKENQARLNSWCAWQGIKAKAVKSGLAPVVEAYENGSIPISRLENFFEATYCRWWASLKIDGNDVLRTFNSKTHADKIKQFQIIDDSYRSLSARYVRAKICSGIPARDNVAKKSEEGKIREVMLQKRPKASVRKMIHDAPNFITKLTPCVLMSPLSIAQYLPADFKAFDVVIFDEASQITVWDAVGSIARAKQTIIAGDPKQMPPSNNFGRGSNESDSDEGGAEEDMESILDEMQNAGITQRHLNWHYRSRHESLITFSNHNYYGGRLITFPSPSTSDQAVSLERVDGIYALGQGRTNIIEARAVVVKIISKLTDPDFNKQNLTLGVVTFNAEQQNLIENLLDKERSNNDQIESHFSEECLEPVFVKNLENVQGDERDIIIFSLTFGKKAEGARMSMNFGPLNKPGGERRLNVAITRARHEMIVFSSFDADEIDLTRTGAEGVKDLKHFVDYAARGFQSIRETVTGSVGSFENPFEEAIADGLRRKGWTLHPQIGVSAFRIDIGIVHPDFSGKYLVGVECDGATYHSSATARDRDKVRESVLSGLGWKLIRIWSTDFWNDAAHEIDRVDKEIQRLLEIDRTERAEAINKQEVVADELAQDEIGDIESVLIDSPSGSGKNVDGAIKTILENENIVLTPTLNIAK